MDKIVLLGGGGHCKSVIDSIEKDKYEIVGILDRKEKTGQLISGIKIIGTDELADRLHRSGVKYAFITTGSIGNVRLRKKLYFRIKKIGFKIPNIIDRSAIVATNIQIGEGNFIGKGAIINSESRIRDMCILNSGVIVEHDCEIENHVHIAPGSVLSGGVKIMSDTHIGTNSTIIQGIQVGYNSIIGAGSVVINNIANSVKAYGVPCKEVGKRE